MVKTLICRMVIKDKRNVLIYIMYYTAYKVSKRNSIKTFQNYSCNYDSFFLWLYSSKCYVCYLLSLHICIEKKCLYPFTINDYEIPTMHIELVIIVWMLRMHRRIRFFHAILDWVTFRKLRKWLQQESEK